MSIDIYPLAGVGCLLAHVLGIVDWPLWLAALPLVAPVAMAILASVVRIVVKGAKA